MSESLDHVLELAAASPDPRVRAGAIKYRQLQRELDELGGFFAFYGREVDNAGPVVRTVSTSRVARSRPTAVRSNTMAKGKRGQVTAMINRVCEMLVEIGAPLPMAEIYKQYYERHPDEVLPVGGSDTFRQRLNGKPHLIQAHGHRYWPTNVPLPESPSLAA